MESLNPELIRKVVAELRISPLIELDPNDSKNLQALVNQAFEKAQGFELATDDTEVLKMLALCINHWGPQFDTQAWAKEILSDTSNESLARIHELHTYKIFQDAGSDATDFASYCILKFKRRVPSTEYENEEIHFASDMALAIAKSYGINDLLNSYMCLEMLLIIGGNFMEDERCQAIQEIFQSPTLSADEKIKQSYDWLAKNIEKIYAQA
ncbi:hypothetical protein [Agaribacterium haliotis]|uniref:hypothetical protein n=1 Tax=Agaribacterium haliotis TaxID=2013869 RepID=UPI000BB5451E|nr:hypothetical protein [Agaribacterium haliotis]